MSTQDILFNISLFVFKRKNIICLMELHDKVLGVSVCVCVCECVSVCVCACACACACACECV